MSKLSLPVRQTPLLSLSQYYSLLTDRSLRLREVSILLEVTEPVSEGIGTQSKRGASALVLGVTCLLLLFVSLFVFICESFYFYVTKSIKLSFRFFFCFLA